MGAVAPTKAGLTVPDFPLAKKAIASEAFIKVMVWAEPGLGKSRLALSFPAPLVADLERSTALYAIEFNFLVAEPSPEMKPHQLVYALVKQIQRGMYPDVKTLVIDPATDYLDHLEAALMEKMRDKGTPLESLNGMAKTKAYSEINEAIRRELDAILLLPLNIVFVVRAKNMWGMKGGKMDVLGRGPDIKDIVTSLCDVVIQLDADRTAIVQKSRIAALPPKIKAPTYAHLEDALAKARITPYVPGEEEDPAVVAVRASQAAGQP
jgi:hypothetical protein